MIDPSPLPPPLPPLPIANDSAAAWASFAPPPAPIVPALAENPKVRWRTASRDRGEAVLVIVLVLMKLVSTLCGAHR